MEEDFSKSWYYEGSNGNAGLFVSRFCPECHKFLTCGTVAVNGFDEVKLEGFICKIHGEIEPNISWDEGEINE